MGLGSTDLPNGPALSEEAKDLTPKTQVGTPINVHQHEPALVVFGEAFGSVQPRQLLTLKIKDGKVVAEYDPADLDEAARIFVEEVERHFGRSTS